MKRIREERKQGIYKIKNCKNKWRVVKHYVSDDDKQTEASSTHGGDLFQMSDLQAECEFD